LEVMSINGRIAYGDPLFFLVADNAEMFVKN